ncbi:exonuclease 1 [Xenopus laevis]|uniref:exonuclease 1 n=1 Tax=Xenopus laevis TaxID=8355 RepID=UPI000044F54A|nr:exonuclease 1 [Xenopus laevis]AAH84102.1 EXOI protein [Xenopus laevis]
MGIQGLLQFLKEASEPVHVKKYKGKTVAVDTYCWLHKGAFACAEKLAKGEPTDQYVQFCMKLVHMLLSFGVKPILVFDGCTLPSKKDVEKARREKRQTNLQKGKQLLREGKLAEARECFSRSVNITSSMAHEVIKAARSEGVDYIVAPYEADSQLAYLNKNDFAEAIITEDSDLLAFGCKKVLLKMDKFGNGLEIDQARFGMCRSLGDVFTEEKFRYMCILSGCDYLPSIHGIGLAKACKLLKVANNPDITKVIQKIGQYLKTNITVPEGYIEGFLRANNTFLYQLVFDPVERKLIPLNPYGNDVNPEELNYAGPNMGDSVALQIALGNMDINTRKQIDDYNPDIPQLSHHRSQSWDNKQLNRKTAHTDSIWYTKSEPCKTTKIEEIHSPRGLILPSKKHTVKRSYEDGVSDTDLISQYSFSKNKKARPDGDDPMQQVPASTMILQPLDDCANTKPKKPIHQPKTRNAFATFLQRQKQDCSSVSATGTRSRFFYKPADEKPHCTEKEQIVCNGSALDIAKETHELTEESSIKTEKEDSLSTISEVCKPNNQRISPLQNQRSCFTWSGSLDSESSPTPKQSPMLLSLQKFHRTTPYMQNEAENKASWQSSCIKSDTVSQIDSNEKLLKKQDIEDTDSDEHASTPESPCQFTMKASPAHQSFFPEPKGSAPKSKVPGLLKSQSVVSGLRTKVKPRAPAKVSGLTNRSNTKATRNNENVPGLQATIGDLWKNFSYKK